MIRVPIWIKNASKNLETQDLPTSQEVNSVCGSEKLGESSEELGEDLDFLDDEPDLVDIRREREKANLETER